MFRALAITLSLIVAAAPVTASAQDRARRGDGDRPRQEQRQDQRPDRMPQREMRATISQAEAQSIAQSRAGGARFVGSRGLQGGAYVFVFDDGGRIFQIAVPAYGN